MIKLRYTMNKLKTIMISEQYAEIELIENCFNLLFTSILTSFHLNGYPFDFIHRLKSHIFTSTA